MTYKRVIGPNIIVLTGGPGGGKTTLINELLTTDTEGKRWFALPESALMLIQGGLDGYGLYKTGHTSQAKKFQKAVVFLQIAHEDICSDVIESSIFLLSHRGALDPLAFWLSNGWAEKDFFTFLNTSREELYKRYFAVIHLETAAIDAEKYYIRDAVTHKRELSKKAAEIDQLCAYVWNRHHNYFFINNKNRNWITKSNQAKTIIDGLIRSS